MSKVALVTGANQGLGLALVKALADRFGPQDTVYLAARSADRGKAALEKVGEPRAQINVVQ